MVSLGSGLASASIALMPFVALASVSPESGPPLFFAQALATAPTSFSVLALVSPESGRASVSILAEFAPG
jgi:hypothetical protein